MLNARVIAICLSVGGTPWAVLLLCYIIGIAQHSPDGAARFAGLFVPGFAAYSVWLLRSFKIRLGNWRHTAWLSAALINFGYLVLMFPPDEFRWDDGFGILVRGWLVLAAGFSAYGFIADRKTPQPEPRNREHQPAPVLPPEQLKELLDQHHRRDK